MVGFLGWLLTKILVLGVIFRLVGTLVEICFFAGIVLCVPDYFKLLK